MNATDDPCPQCVGSGHEHLVDGTPVPCGVCDETGVRPAHMLSADHCDRLWREASTYAEMCELTALWLDGRLPRSITYDGVPDPETADIPAGLLAGLCRAGYLTDLSQPAHGWEPGFDNAGYRQRAYVEFLVPAEQVGTLVWAAVTNGLWVNARKPTRLRLWSHTNTVPVTETGEYTPYGAEAVTLAGVQVPTRYWRWIGLSHRNGAMARILASSYQVSIVDLTWGRNDLLWDTLAPLTTSKENVE